MERLNIVYITDGNFEKPCGVSLFSVLENNKDMEMEIYVLENGISEEARNRYADWTSRIHFIDIRDFMDRTDAFDDANGFRPIVYARLLLTQYLPDSIDKVLYLDGDTIVNGSLKALAKMQLSEDIWAAAVPEAYMPTKIMQRSIGFSKGDIYYNAGVMLINVRAWRENNLTERFIRYLIANKDRIRFNDQDILNACCKGHVQMLQPTYNMNPNLPWFPVWFVERHLVWGRLLPGKEAYRRMLENPVIVHYMGDERPWIVGNHNYYGKLWERYAEACGWKTDTKGRNLYLLLYHILNRITSIFPWLRIVFSRWIGIRVYEIKSVIKG